MITKVLIKSLFNLYSYVIDLSNSDGSKIKFVTGGNGYGKTTLLNFINDVMLGSYNRMFAIPFDDFQLQFVENNEELNIISVQKSVINTVLDSQSDDIENSVTTLKVSLSRVVQQEVMPVENYTLTKGADGNVIKKGASNNIEMFFASKSCYYITDKRLMKLKTDKDTLSAHLDEFPLKTYADKLKKILDDPQSKKQNQTKIDKFKQIIDGCDYSNKRLEIDKRFGFRFVANDALETKLSLEDLSSGEKHMIIQVFGLLFEAPSGSIVLIDEPELSFHMMWQMDYLKNLEDILSVVDLQCVVATHSPQIFNGMWSKSVDLYTLSREQ